jgi:hypothetical protein
MTHEVKGYYSIVQFCPDPSRLEAANLGVLLYCPETRFLDVRLSPGHDRLAHFFGRTSFDPDMIDIAKDGIRSRLRVEKDSVRSLDDLNRFIATRANELRITPPRSMKVADPVQALDALFKDLVGGRANVRKGRHDPLLELDAAFRRPVFAGKMRFNERVLVPIVDREIHIPYSYQNGSLNLIKPQQLLVGRQTMDRVTSLAYEGNILQKHKYPDGLRRQLTVISMIDAKTTQEKEDTAKHVKAIFGYHQIATVFKEQIPDFVVKVEREIH